MGDTRAATLADRSAAAAAVLQGVARITPILDITVPGLDAPLALKLENLQVTGSFKVRGALAALHAARAERDLAGCVAYSAGNHGAALARAAATLGIPATVVMPESAEPAKLELVAAAGARIVRVAPDELSATAHALAEDRGIEFVSPFDDERVIAGQGTVGLEMLAELAELDTILVPVGGGGLIAGVSAVIAASGRDIEVVAVEPDRAADLSESLRAGRIIPWSRDITFTTIADGLRAPAVGARPWSVIRHHVADALTVSEDEIRAAMRLIAAETRTVVEPSGAVATAAALARPERFAGRKVAAIVSGGNIEPRGFEEILGAAP